MDTLNPPWKTGYRQVGGWYRFNAFLTHRPHGDFCPGVYGSIAGVPTRPKPGRGSEYRITANGPGYYVAGLSNLFPTRNMRGPYNASLDHALNADQRKIDPRPQRKSSCYYTH